MGERKEESARRTGGKGGGLKVREREERYRRGGEGKRRGGRRVRGVRYVEGSIYVCTYIAMQ